MVIGVFVKDVRISFFIILSKGYSVSIFTILYARKTLLIKPDPRVD